MEVILFCFRVVYILLFLVKFWIGSFYVGKCLGGDLRFFVGVVFEIRLILKGVIVYDDGANKEEFGKVGVLVFCF